MATILVMVMALGFETSMLNPRALEFIERDPTIERWAVSRFDRNHDGWLTLFEAQEAVREFRMIADENGDGRVTPREYDSGIAFLKARYRP